MWDGTKNHNDSFEEVGGDEVDYNPLFATNQRFATRGKAYEFALVIANSGRKNRSQPELRASYFRCSKYGSSKVDYDPKKPKRKSKTVKCRCIFRIRAIENYHFQDTKRLVLWNIVTADGFGCHNHQPTKYKDCHRHYTGLNEEEKAYINPDTHELTHVFMSHLEAVKLFRAYPHVVLINYTYKTNIYNMALVEVVGVTPAGSSFLIACLLRKLMDILECTGASPSCFVAKRELGLVGALRTLFPETPHLLCRWHVNRDIESRALKIHKTVFYKDHVLKNPETGWWNVIDATCKEDFNKGEHATQFVLCYTNDYFHLGNTATSRVESAHSLLKAWLKSAHLKLDTMWSRIHSMLEGQHCKIRKELEDSISRPRTTHRLFSLLQGKVSTKAIEIMEDEVKRGVALGIRLELGCGCVLRTTHDLPCACTLIDLKNNGSRVHLSDIHPFWRTLEYNNDEAMPKNDNDMFEELVNKARQNEDILASAVRENPKGRPRGSKTRSKSDLEHSLRKYGTPSTDASTNVQHMVGDFAPGVAGAPLEKNYTKGLLSMWVKRFGVPKELWSHFDGWVDVGSDSHCGLRVLSHALWGGEEDYIQMRHWTICVFASLFNWTICVIAENCYAKGPKEWQCMTILPLRSSNEDVAPYGVLWILNHKSHWMRLHTKGPPDEVHMPPIEPAWIVFRESSVQHLAELYKTNNDN
ncbi:hypothetical protein RND81_12G089500 [Saponaria officinalis]|uniref:MULE transposase domain-containing protein n=1 Tax=Saponaria officinalis TaxID=3572 RepID=A0AAW1H8A6_SAPOF